MSSPLGRQCLLAQLPPDSRGNPKTNVSSSPGGSAWEALKLMETQNSQTLLLALSLSLFAFSYLSSSHQGRPGPATQRRKPPK